MCKMLELAEDMRSILEKKKKGDVVYQQFRNLVMYKIDCEHQSLSRLTCTVLTFTNNAINKAVNYPNPLSSLTA